MKQTCQVMTSSSIQSINSRRLGSQSVQLAGLLLTLALGYFTYFRHYDTPAALFWDENYHIASAQKYLHGIFFMEPHPPLGKLLIALGEHLVSPNIATDQFLKTDQASELPADFSFAGYRFFPALFAWLAAGVLFLLFLEITGCAVRAFIFTTPYLFDNALIVHSRGAMLEGPQLFFVILFLLFLNRWLKQAAGRFDTLFLGLALGAALSIKINSAFLLVLPLVGWWFQRKQIRGVVSAVFTIYASALFLVCCVWMVHFHLGKKIEPALPNAGFYNASDEYKSSLLGGSQVNFFTALSDNIGYARNYTAGVPSLNPCKQGENGSHPLFWPLGGSAILYRWDSSNDLVRYLYLQSNPASWGLALLAVLIISASALVTFTHDHGAAAKKLQPFALTLLFGYWAYMLTVLNVERVLYLYHYFMPLVLGYILLPFAVDSIERIGRYRIGPSQRWIVLGVCVSIIVASYIFFSPLTYYQPLTSDQLQSRGLLSLWKLRCVNCGES